MKKYITGILAVILAIGGTAFTAKKTTHSFKKKMGGPFYYLYDLNTVAGENTASNYSYISPQPGDPGDVPGCNGSAIPCVILATGTSGTSGVPDASQVNATNLPGNTETQKSTQ